MLPQRNPSFPSPVFGLHPIADPARKEVGRRAHFDGPAPWLSQGPCGSPHGPGAAGLLSAAKGPFNRLDTETWNEDTLRNFCSMVMFVYCNCQLHV